MSHHSQCFSGQFGSFEFTFGEPHFIFLHSLNKTSLSFHEVVKINATFASDKFDCVILGFAQQKGIFCCIVTGCPECICKFSMAQHVCDGPGVKPHWVWVTRKITNHIAFCVQSQCYLNSLCFSHALGCKICHNLTDCL